MTWKLVDCLYGCAFPRGRLPRRWGSRRAPGIGRVALEFIAIIGAHGLLTARDVGAEEPPSLAPELLSVVEHPGGTIELVGLERAGAWGPLLARAAVEVARELPARIGTGLPPRVRVVYCPNASTFAQMSRLPDPAHHLGAARPDQGLVFLNGSLLGTSFEADPVRTLRHELAHLAIGQAFEEEGGVAPRWFDEGVASWFAGGFAELGPLDLAPAQTRGGLSLDRLAYGFPEDLDGRRVAYVKSQLVVELLESKQAGTVAAIGKALQRGIPFPDALRAESGVDVAGLEAEFQRATAPHGLFLAVLRRSFSPVLVMSGLVLVGFAVKRIRARRRHRQWEQEERGQVGEQREIDDAPGGPGA